MQILTRTRPGLMLKARNPTGVQWSQAFGLGRPYALAVQLSVSSIYLITLDEAENTLEERWAASVEDALQAANREFQLRAKDWVYRPGWQRALALAGFAQLKN